MYLALEKSRTGIDCLINAFSGGKGYAHVDLVFTDKMFFTSIAIAHDGIPAGVVLHPERPHPLELWDWLPLNLTLEQEAVVRANAAKLVGAPYDWNGIWRWVLPWMHEHPTRYFCSEAVTAAFQPLFIPDTVKAWKVSPNDIPEVFKELAL